MSDTGKIINIIDNEGYLVSSISLVDGTIILDDSKYKLAKEGQTIKIRGDVK